MHKASQSQVEELVYFAIIDIQLCEDLKGCTVFAVKIGIQFIF